MRTIREIIIQQYSDYIRAHTTDRRGKRGSEKERKHTQKQTIHTRICIYCSTCNVVTLL